MFIKKEKIPFEKIGKIYGIEDIDEIYHEMLEKMDYSVPSYKDEKKPIAIESNTYQAILAMYSQNYIFLHYLIKMEKQNRKLTEQNQQVIEQNEKLVTQNQQIIELLTEIKNK